MKKETEDTNFGISVKLNKLKIRNKIALTKNKRLDLGRQAADLGANLDSTVRSVALGRFVFRRAAKLKHLGKLKGEIDNFILGVTASESTIVDKTRSKLGSLGLSTKFSGLTVDEILKKAGASTEKPATTDDLISQFVSAGDLTSANHLLNTIIPEEVNTRKLTSEASQSDQLDELVTVNKGILDKLTNIEENQIDEQDTSIDLPTKRQETKDAQVALPATQAPVAETSGSSLGGIVSSILKAMFGTKLVKFLMSSKGSVSKFIKTVFSKGWGFVKNKLAPLIQQGMAKFTAGITKILSKIPGLGSVVDKVKTFAKSSIKSAKKNITLDKVKTKGKSIAKGGIKKVSGIKKVASKLPKSLAKSKIGGKATGAIKKLLKFTKPIPMLGTVIAAGTAIYAAQDGYRHADEVLGKNKSDLTTMDRVASAGGMMMEDASFGLVDAKSIADKILALVNDPSDSELFVTHAELIKHNFLGDSEIIDWARLERLPSKDIKQIIKIDDWDKEDSIRLHDVMLAKSAQEKLEKMYSKEKNDWLIKEKKERDEINRLRLLSGKDKIRDNGRAMSDAEYSDYQANRAKSAMIADVKSGEGKTETESNVSVGKVNYKMTKPMTLRGDNGGADGVEGMKDTMSLNPDDYRVDDLFKLHKTNANDINSLNTTMLSNLKGLGAEYFEMFGDRIQINSAYRSFEEQAELKDKYGAKAAQPGKSMHNYGLAVDMNSINAERAIGMGLFQKYGFARPVAGETWHVEAAGIDRAQIRKNGMAEYAAKLASRVSVKKPSKPVGQEGSKDKAMIAKLDKSHLSEIVQPEKQDQPELLKEKQLETQEAAYDAVISNSKAYSVASIPVIQQAPSTVNSINTQMNQQKNIKPSSMFRHG